MGKVIEVKNSVLKEKEHYLTQDYSNSHKGLDLVGRKDNKNGTDYIVSIYDGEVYTVEKQKTGGNVVGIKHPNGVKSVYGHLKDNSIKVKKGELIKKGDVIGYMGATGIVSGSHLHLGIYDKNKKLVDPKPYLLNEELFEEYWTTGKYKLTVAKTIRTSTSLVLTNRVKVKNCMASVKPLLTSKKPNDIAIYKVGSEVNITQIIKKDGRVWGKLQNCYIVLCNKDGTKQATKLG